MFRAYALAPETIQRMLRRAFWRFQWMVTGTFLVFGLYLAFFAGPVRWQVAGPIIGIIALAYFFIIFFSYRSQLRLLYSLRYELDGSSIVYRQLKQDPMRIMRADITFVEGRKEGLMIHTVDSDVKLLVPYGLARTGDDDVRGTLEAWTGEPAGSERRAESTRRFWMVGIGGALLILLFANSLLAVLLLGTAVVAAGKYTERRLARGQDATPGAMQMYNMAFSFLVFILIMKTCFISMAIAMAR